VSIAGINQAKIALSAELARQIAEFEARGGRIEYVPIISRSREKYQGYNNNQAEMIDDPSLKRVAVKNKSTRGRKPGAVAAKIEAAHGRPAREIVMETVKRLGNYTAAAKELGHSKESLMAIWGDFETFDHHVVNGVRDTISGHSRRYKRCDSVVRRRIKRGETLRQALDIDPVEGGRTRRRDG